MEPDQITINNEYRIQKEFESLMTDYLSSNHRRQIDRITKAFNFTKQTYSGLRRSDGDPYIMHPLAVARIVCGEMGLGSTSICAALLHEVTEDSDYEVEDLANLFTRKIADIVDGMNKISGGVFGKNAAVQADNLRRLLLTMNNDIRVILVKMADRLHNMRTLASEHADKQFKIAGETMFLYAPLAHRLGLFAIKTELEDLCFKYEHPEEYHFINEKLIQSEKSRQLLFDNFAKPVRHKLQHLDLTYEMKSRVKTAFSIWNKMNNKGVPFEDIYDIFAIRIIFEPTGDVDEKNLCWDIYAAITSIYRTRPDRLRDWVSRPKETGYQALHLTVMSQDGQWIEIQIRSKHMDEISEKGLAAHWKYKEHAIGEESSLDKWMQTITEILENPNPNSLDFLDTIKMNLFSTEIFVFTPKGDMVTLPKGATALDFAYKLHTSIGNSCIGAKVNHNLVSLSHQLDSGDQVEIITSKSQHPKAEWLNYVTTAKARTRIETVLRRDRKELAEAGMIKVKEALTKASLEPTHSNFDRLALYFGFSKREDFYYAIEKEEVALPDNLHKILKEKNTNLIVKGLAKIFGLGSSKTTLVDADQTEEKEPFIFDKTRPYLLREDAFGQPNYIVADCCKPTTGNDVFGFINDDNTVIIHKQTCRIGLRLKNNFGDRILSVAWSSHANTAFETTIKVVGIDAKEVPMEIVKTISDYHVTLIRLLLESKDGMFEGKIKMLVNEMEDFQKICLSLSKIKNVKSVARMVD